MSEKIYALIGGNGYYQYFILTLIFISQLNNANNIFISIFINHYQDFQCEVKVNQFEHVFIQHRTQFKSFNNVTQTLIIDNQGCKYETVKKICSEVYLASDPMTSTIRSQFELFCENDRLTSLTVLVFMLGICIGSFVGGLVSDRFGRKIGCIVGYLLICIFSTTATFAFAFPLYVFARLFGGFSVGFTFVSNIGLLLEIVHAKDRSDFGFYWSIGHDCGYVLLVVLAFYIRSHFYLMLVSTGIAYLNLGFSFFYRESFRWLLVQKKFDEAKQVLKYMARFNKKYVTTEDIDIAIKSTGDNEETKTVGKVSIWEVRHYKVVLLNLVILWFMFVSSSFSYYTFVLGSASISDQIFITTIISSVSCTVVRYIYMILCRKIGKIPILLSLQIGITFLFFASMILKHFLGNRNMVTLAALMFSTALSGANFGVLWNYGGETFPTVIRASSVSIGSAFASVSGMVASQMEYVFVMAPNALPIAGAVMAIISSIFTFFLLPESFNKPSLDFLHEAERYFVEWRQPWKKSGKMAKDNVEMNT